MWITRPQRKPGLSSDKSSLIETTTYAYIIYFIRNLFCGYTLWLLYFPPLHDSVSRAWWC